MTIRKLLSRLGFSLAVLVGSILLCVLYSYLHPSSLAYVALALLVLWYIYIPLLFVIVSGASFLAQRCKRRES